MSSMTESEKAFIHTVEQAFKAGWAARSHYFEDLEDNAEASAQAAANQWNYWVKTGQTDRIYE